MVCTHLYVDISYKVKDNHAIIKPERLRKKEGSEKECMNLSGKGKYNITGGLGVCRVWNRRDQLGGMEGKITGRDN